MSKGILFSETFTRVQRIHQLDDILDKIFIVQPGGLRFEMTDFKEFKQEPMYPNTKFSIDIKKIFGRNEMTEVHFEFKKYANFSIEIKIEDKEYTSVRPLLENEMKQKRGQNQCS